MRCKECRRHCGPGNTTATGKCIFCAPPDEWKPEWTDFGEKVVVALHGRECVIKLRDKA